jgi:iron complex outermembrane receptor protein
MLASAQLARAQSASASRRFDIPAGSLPRALAAFGRQSGLQVAYRPAIAAGVRSPGASGDLAPATALAYLLAGTGLSYRFGGAGVVTIERSVASDAEATAAGAVPLDPIDIGAEKRQPNAVIGNLTPSYAGGQVATGGQLGLLGNRDVMSTPFNQTSYTAKTIADQQARNIVDVMFNDPSVSVGNSPARGVNDLYIRGLLFSTSDMSLNGLFGVSPALTVLPYFIERVEVLKGPNALLNGMPLGGSVGGGVNIVSKRAPDEPLTQVNTSYVSRGQFIEHVDIARRFGQDKAFGLRFNGAYGDGETAVAGMKDQIGLATLGIDYRGDNLRLSADGGYQVRVARSPSQYIFFSSSLPSLPNPPSASKSYSPQWSYSSMTDLFGMTQGEVDLTDAITAYAGVGARKSRWHILSVYPTIESMDGASSALPSQYVLIYNDLSAQVGARARFDTGPLRHALNVNASQVDEILEYGYAVDGASAYSFNIYAPTHSLLTPLPEPDVRKSWSLTLSSVGVADTISAFDERVQLTAGVRRQQVTQDNFDMSTGAVSSSYDQGAWSPAFALVVKPLENVSLYGNYIEGLQQGTVVGAAYGNAGEKFPPFQSKQFEAGVKVDWGRLTTTVSLFEITQPSMITTTSGGLDYLRRDGQQRNRGIEFNFFGEVTDGVRLLGGLTLLDGRLTKTEGGANDGNKAVAAPDRQLSFGVEWDTPFAPGLTVNGRVLHTSRQYLDAANSMSIPGYARVDLGARYKFEGPLGKPMTVRFNVENIADANYWAYPYYGTASVAQPRTFVLSTSVAF